MEVESRLNPEHGLRNDKPSTSRWRRPRSSANLIQQVAQSATPLSNPTVTEIAQKSSPKLERAPSKMSLFNLFSRPKVEKARGHTEVGLAVPMPPPAPKPAPVSTPKSSLRLNPSPHSQQVHRSRSSQMLRPMSMRPASVKKQPDNNWDPPPLFQAYPQSIKYATLQACVFSPDALLRTQSQRKQYDVLRERMDSHRDLATTLETAAEGKKLEKTHKRLISNSVHTQATPQLTNKVYVLVTSGHVLQYSGDGAFDRRPEKVLKLGKESAAFACDLIPGKHWVLQISQSANQDGTVSIGPKSSLLSRLRMQNTSAKRAATSFLLVLESAEEMDAWMTAVRKEIDNLGGMKAKREESIRESSSLEESPVKPAETPSHRYLVQRDPNRMSKLAPIDSPLQSQYSDSPKIVASDWEGDRNEKTVSIAESPSLHSSRHASKRRSETPSIATTIVSTDQHQLDQLRERSRYSYISTATSISGTGTRNTSRNSSPTPNSPLNEGCSPAESEPLRSATSLRSFHMAATTRRRSMQPLPVTNEDNSVSASLPRTPQRHSIYGPTSPTIRTPEILDLNVPVSTVKDPTPNACFRAQTQGPVRYSVRSSSAPPARNTLISPPPRDPAPVPPGRPHSTIGSLPSAALPFQLSATASTTTSLRSERRVSQSPKPFLRPFPVRPQNTDGSVVVPRRYSSMAPPPIPLGVVINRSSTTPARPPSAVPSYTPTTNRNTSASSPSQQLRRPNSVQVRPQDHAPFLSSRAVSAPVRAISSTPSFVPGNRASTSPSVNNRASASPSLGSRHSTLTSLDRVSGLERSSALASMERGSAFSTLDRTSTLSDLAKRSSVNRSLNHSPSIPVLSQQAQQAQRGITPRRSMPAMGLPPPAPPPNMPLPPPPPNMPLPAPPPFPAPRAMAV